MGSIGHLSKRDSIHFVNCKALIFITQAQAVIRIQNKQLSYMDQCKVKQSSDRWSATMECIDLLIGRSHNCL